VGHSLSGAKINLVFATYSQRGQATSGNFTCRRDVIWRVFTPRPELPPTNLSDTDDFKDRSNTAQVVMAETDTISGPQSPSLATKTSGARQRTISSCLTCRRRKVKCDHVHPICGACTRGSHACTWTDIVQGQTIAGRISKPPVAGNGKIAKSGDIQSRLDRLEKLLEKAVTGRDMIPTTSVRSSAELEARGQEAQSTPYSTSHAFRGGAGMASDDGDGTLLLEGGKSQFVSSLHYALLAEEVSITHLQY
jgi:hypothetical protein